MVSRDLRQIIKDWPYEPGQISVRKIRGVDGRPKIQMRVDLGLLQMEPEGRPDGRRPHDYESLLHYHLERVSDYQRRNGTDLGFILNEEECQDLREEALQYYQRYLANFALEDFAAVARDTRRNLEVLDMCAEYAEDESDRYALEQYRPYILMMYTRSKALGAMEKEDYRSALSHVQAGIREIREFFRKFNAPKAYRLSGEVHVLKALRRQIRSYLPADPTKKLRRQLRRALAEERYEDAATLRDKLDALNGQDNTSANSD